MDKFMKLIGTKARKASEKRINKKTKNKVLKIYSQFIEKEKKTIFKENLKDVEFANKKGLKQNLIDRLRIDEKKLKSIKYSIIKIIKLKDPVNIALEKWKRPNGLKINKV